MNRVLCLLVIGYLYMHCPPVSWALGIIIKFFLFLFIAVMALRTVTRRFGSKFLPMFSSTNLLHSHATSFGWFISLSPSLPSSIPCIKI